MFTQLKHHFISLVFIILSCLLYYSFGHDLQREDSIKLIAMAVAGFFLAHQLLKREQDNFIILLGAGLLYRLVLFGATPELSQDFYRYIWDGELLVAGINPYLQTPNELIEGLQSSLPNAAYLYEKMGWLSQKHHSNYPPISQYLYALVAYLAQGSIPTAIILFKVIVLLADIAVLFLSRRLMRHIGIAPWKAFWYFLNPLVVMELSGNLHLEGVMIAFFLAASCLLLKKPGAIGQSLLAALCIALAIMTKLIPILFYPFLLAVMGFKKWLQVGVYVIIFCGLFLWPLLGEGFFNYYIETIGLWFNNFEFNAAMYNLVKSISVLGGNSAYKTILGYGKILPFLILGLAVCVMIWQHLKAKGLKNHPRPVLKMHGALYAMLYMYSGYLFLATTVHPWYLIFGLTLSLFTHHKYFIYWSLAVFLSYTTYADPAFKENLWIIGIEYLAVLGVLGYEIVKIKTPESFSVKNV